MSQDATKNTSTVALNEPLIQKVSIAIDVILLLLIVMSNNTIMLLLAVACGYIRYGKNLPFYSASLAKAGLGEKTDMPQENTVSEKESS